MELHHRTHLAKIFSWKSRHNLTGTSRREGSTKDKIAAPSELQRKARRVNHPVWSYRRTASSARFVAPQWLAFFRAELAMPELFKNS